MDSGRFAATFINPDTGWAARARVNAHFSNDSAIQATLNKLAHIGDSEPLAMREATVSIPEGTMGQASWPNATGDLPCPEAVSRAFDEELSSC